jgi:hypothetical protein
MTEQEKARILQKAKTFFRDEICVNHRENTKKASDLDAYNVNPFLFRYLANFGFGDSSAESIARALVYPRVFGTSINTTFGTKMQFFCNSVLDGLASVVSGIDIEFIDSVDGRRKYCQCKVGPNTINRDDVASIIGHFNNIKGLARTNQNLGINPSIDCIVGVLYGEPHQLSTHYVRINAEYPVICGKDFWHHLTGDETFYSDLAQAFGEVAEEVDGRGLLEETVRILAREIEQKHI